MATNNTNVNGANATNGTSLNKEYDTSNHNRAIGTNGHHTTAHQRAAHNHGGNPLAHMHSGDSSRLPAFGGEFQPGLYRSVENRKFANPAPLGLCAFALTTFVLSLINIGVRDVLQPNLVLSLAYGYGGLVQLLAGMWEMAVGNTFGATALSSYGGFWISYGILLTPAFNIGPSYAVKNGPQTATSANINDWGNVLGYYLIGWFIFTTILLLCTLKSTVAFFLLFFTLDMAFLLLALGHFYTVNGVFHEKLIVAGGYFGLFAAFLAWYNALAGIADSSNSFFTIPVAHFPWSAKAREERNKSKREID